MRWRSILLTSLLCPILTHAATTQPATTQSLAQYKQAEQEKYLHELAALPELKLPTGQFSDICHIALEKDLIIIHPALAPTDQPMRCTVKGFDGPCSVIVTTEHVPNGGVTALQFTHRDFGNPQENFRHTMLFAHAGSMQISMDLDGLVFSKSASLIEDIQPEDPERAVRINAQLFNSLTDDVIGQYNLAAPTFREMRRKYPRETQMFIVPILRDLQAEAVLTPDPRVIQQVLLTPVKPDQALSKKLDAVLAKFDSDNFQDREQAAKELSDLGQPAASALMNADRKNWSIDRQSGVDAFLAQFKAMPADQIAALRKDPVFLLDCQFSDDPTVRTSAAEMFSKISHVKIDPNATGAERDRMIDLAYTKILPPLTTRPSTQPA